MNSLIMCAACIGLLFLSGCATHDGTVYKLYPGQGKPQSEVATLELFNASSAVIDGLHVSHGDYAKVHLLPGLHHIKWTSVHGVSVLIEPSGFAQQDSQSDIILEAGHTYRLRSDRTTGPGYSIYHWIEDITTDNVIAGHKKP
jgi:hypothetical protein